MWYMFLHQRYYELGSHCMSLCGWHDDNEQRYWLYEVSDIETENEEENINIDNNETDEEI